MTAESHRQSDTDRTTMRQRLRGALLGGVIGGSLSPILIDATTSGIGYEGGTDKAIFVVFCAAVGSITGYNLRDTLDELRANNSSATDEATPVCLDDLMFTDHEVAESVTRWVHDEATKRRAAGDC